jgi:hypothetical protein
MKNASESGDLSGQSVCGARAVRFRYMQLIASQALHKAFPAHFWA